MPTQEGELTSIYSILDCQELFLFTCGEQKLCQKKSATLLLIPQMRINRFLRTTPLKAYITYKQKHIHSKERAQKQFCAFAQNE